MFWDPLYERAAAILGAPPDQLKMVTCFLISYPLASIFYRIPASRPNIAHLFSIFVASFFFVFMLNLTRGFLHMLADCVITYAIVLSSRSAGMPWVVFGLTMGHLFFIHAQRVFIGVPEGSGDITFSSMITVQKLTMFAWHVHDGRRKIEDLDDNQRSTRLSHLPSPLAFFGYCLFFPTVLVGPSLDYATYDALVLRTLYKQSSLSIKGSDGKAIPSRKPYGRKRVAYLQLAVGLGFMGIFSVLGARADYHRILSPAWGTWGKAARFGFIQFAGVIARTKYYGAWSMTDGACILTGVGFNGYDPKTGRTMWNRLRNINIMAIETSESFKVLFDNWNCRTNVWLRDCVYTRLVKKGQKPGTMQSMFTFLTSAIWHGLEPGYYLAFISAGLLTSLGRTFRRFVRPYFVPSPPTSPTLSKRAYDLVGWFMLQINLNYIASSFVLLDVKECFKAYHRMGWYTHILVVLSIAFFQSGGRRALRRGLEKRGVAVGGRPAKVRTETEDKEVPSVKVHPPSPLNETDEREEKGDLRWMKHALDQPGNQDGGSRMGMDAGLFEKVAKGAETPGVETSREGSPIMWSKKNE